MKLPNANLAVVEKEKMIDLQEKELKKETANFSKTHVVVEGETLSGISARHYGDPALWRAIGLENGVENLRDLPVGLELLIPQLPYREPESGEIYQ